MNKSEEFLADIPIFIDGEEVVERPRFTNKADFCAYLAKVAEGRDLCVVVAHPHTDDDAVLGVYIGKGDPPKCACGCDS